MVIFYTFISYIDQIVCHLYYWLKIHACLIQWNSRCKSFWTLFLLVLIIWKLGYLVYVMSSKIKTSSPLFSVSQCMNTLEMDPGSWIAESKPHLRVIQWCRGMDVGYPYNTIPLYLQLILLSKASAAPTTIYTIKQNREGGGWIWCHNQSRMLIFRCTIILYTNTTCVHKSINEIVQIKAIVIIPPHHHHMIGHGTGS